MCRHRNPQLGGRTWFCQRNIWKANTVIRREARGWIVDGAGGWPQAWLDTEEETMKGRLFLSSPPPALHSLSDAPGCAAWRENERGHCWSSWPNWTRALLLLQSLPALCCWKDLHGNHPAGSWGNGLWEVIPCSVSVVIPSLPSAGADGAAAPWGALSALRIWGGMGWVRGWEQLRKSLFFPTEVLWACLVSR